MDLILHLFSYLTLSPDFPLFTIFKYLFWIAAAIFVISLLFPVFHLVQFINGNDKYPITEHKGKSKTYSVHNIRDLFSPNYYEALLHAKIISELPKASLNELQIKGIYGTYTLNYVPPTSFDEKTEGELLTMLGKPNSITNSVYSGTVYFFHKEYSALEHFILHNEVIDPFSEEDKDIITHRKFLPVLILKSLFWGIIFYLLAFGAGAGMYDYYYSNGIVTQSFTEYESPIGYSFRNYFESADWTKDTSSFPVVVHFQGKHKSLSGNTEKESIFIFKFISQGSDHSYLSEVTIDGVNMTLFQDIILKAVFEGSKNTPYQLKPLSDNSQSLPAPSEVSNSSIFPPGIYSDISGLNFVYLEELTETFAKLLLVSAKPASEEIAYTSTLTIELDGFSGEFRYNDDVGGSGFARIKFDHDKKTIYLKTTPDAITSQLKSWPIKFDDETLTFEQALPDDYHSDYFKDYYKNSPHYN